MEQNLIDIYDLIEHAIDNAFSGQMNLKFYDYLKETKTKKHEVDAFIASTTTNEIDSLILDLDEYIKGGNDSLSSLRRETMFIQLLEGLHPSEAEIICLVKDKQLQTKYNIKSDIVKEAYPDIQWGDRS